MLFTLHIPPKFPPIGFDNNVWGITPKNVCVSADLSITEFLIPLYQRQSGSTRDWYLHLGKG